MFDYYSGVVAGLSRPHDDQEDPNVWLAQVQRAHRMIFREGARAGLDKRFDGLGDDSLARLGWLAEQGVFGEDITALVAELERWREKGDAINSSYGLTDSDIHSMVAEGFHTAFRKAVDSPEAVVIHKLIKDMDPETWAAIIDFVANPIIRWLREAEAKAAEQADAPDTAGTTDPS
jgi:hypothetical protein